MNLLRQLGALGTVKRGLYPVSIKSMVHQLLLALPVLILVLGALATQAQAQSFAYLGNGDIIDLSTNPPSLVKNSVTNDYSVPALPGIIQNYLKASMPAVSPDGKFAYIADGPLYVFDTTTRTQITGSPFAWGMSGPWDLDVSPNGAWVYGVSYGGTQGGGVYAYETATKNFYKIPGTGFAYPRGVVFTSDSMYAWVPYSNGSIIKVNVATKTVVETLNIVTLNALPINDCCEGLALSPDDTMAYTAQEGNSSRLAYAIDLSTGLVTATYTVGFGDQKRVAMAPDGGSVWISNNFSVSRSNAGWGENADVNRIALPGNSVTNVADDTPDLKRGAMDVAISTDSKLALVTRVYGQEVRLFNVADGLLAHTVSLNSRYARFVAIPRGSANPDSEGPIVSGVTLDPNPAPAGTAATLTATVDDTDTGGSVIASAKYTIDGGDGVSMNPSDNTFDGVVEGVTAVVPGQQPGVYEVCVSGTDSAANTGGSECIMLPVYDPEGGFVTGGGWVVSPSSADLTNGASGKAIFGFVSKYLPGRSTPDGSLEFRFKDGDISFKSTSMEWLVVTGEPRAMFRGEGLLNDANTCKFEVDAWDESFSGGDAFGLKLFACGPVADVNRYDLPATALGGGSIKIHKK